MMRLSRVTILLLGLLLASSACSLGKLSPKEKETALAGIASKHAEMISALGRYKEVYGFYPTRKENLIEEHLLRVSSLPETTTYANAGATDGSINCAKEYRETLQTDRRLVDRALVCAKERAGKRKVSLQLAREVCPEYFPAEEERARKKTSLEVNSNCSMGFQAYRLTAEVHLGKKTAWAVYSSESANWQMKDKP